MKNAFVKDSLRHVRGTLHRFLSILIITALGVAFFAGLRASGPDMRSTASSYYDTLNFMDVRMLSNMGFNQDDIKAVESVDGISGVMPAYSYDALAQLTDQNMTIRLQSLSEKPNGQNDINRPKLIEGRLPNRRGECLADSQFLLYSGYKVGDTVQIISGTNSPVSDSLKIDRFKIVGTSENPLYISYERGSSSVGSGKTEAYLLIQPDDFNISVYTEI
ncbi:MAG: hypothetical protein K0R90_704 [Oscillospiraceae bacterium]|nr:hypothetical protein [Oscillospiraceae bacterium]